LKIDFDKTLKEAERDELDLDYVAKHHAYSAVAESFGIFFENWYFYLDASVNLLEGGYPFDRNDFTEYEWQAMGFISNHKKAKQWQSTLERPR
jgi:hypothetical protein